MKWQHQTHTRRSLDSVWPLKRADGTPWHKPEQPVSNVVNCGSPAQARLRDRGGL